MPKINVKGYTKKINGKLVKVKGYVRNIPKKTTNRTPKTKKRFTKMDKAKKIVNFMKNNQDDELTDKIINDTWGSYVVYDIGWQGIYDRNAGFFSDWHDEVEYQSEQPKLNERYNEVIKEMAKQKKRMKKKKKKK